MNNIVFWNNIPVGILTDVKCDNFYYYGKWQLLYREGFERFLQELESNEQAYVCVGSPERGVVGVVYERPELCLDFTVFGAYKDITTVIHDPLHYESLFFK